MPGPPALLAAAVARLSLSPKQIAAFMKRVEQRPNMTRPLVPSGHYAMIDGRVELYRRELRAAGLDPNAKFDSLAAVA